MIDLVGKLGRTEEMEFYEIAEDIQSSLMLLMKDTDGETAYDCLCDIIVDLEALEKQYVVAKSDMETYKRRADLYSKAYDRKQKELTELEEKFEALKKEKEE